MSGAAVALTLPALAVNHDGRFTWNLVADGAASAATGIRLTHIVLLLLQCALCEDVLVTTKSRCILDADNSAAGDCALSSPQIRSVLATMNGIEQGRAGYGSLWFRSSASLYQVGQTISSSRASLGADAFKEELNKSCSIHVADQDGLGS